MTVVFSGTTSDLMDLTDDELDARIIEWFGRLGPVTSNILPAGIGMLLLEKQRRVTSHLLDSSRTIETLTECIAKLTKWLVGLTVALCILTIALTVLTAALVRHGG
jgi:hypothetical protein